jgi:hypothetical protein
MPNKIFAAAQGFRTRDLIQAGVDHLASAKVLFKLDFRCFDSAGYLAHLGLELLFKSLLLHVAGEFPAGHSLRRLKAQVAALLPQYESVLSDDLLAEFDLFKELRYPLPSEPVGIGTSDWIALEDALPALFAAAPPEWTAELEAIKRNEKGGRVLMVKDVSCATDDHT